MNGSPGSFPSELGGYRITGRLGQGAMADVYDAEDSTGHTLALKVFRSGGGMSYTMLERFRREAEATKKLRRHPYILTVYATGQEGDYHYIAMERVDNSRSMEVLIRKRPPVAQVLKIVIKIASALQYAHEHQIIHRDVKPSNLLLDEFDEPLLADFGVAELMDWPSLTLSGTLTGTPMYMSPEQARSEEVTPASDVYSLAVVLYETLTGVVPYELPDPPSTSTILDAVKNQAPLPPRKRDKRISKNLNYVILRALRKNPAERYASAREFSHDLEAVLEGRPVTARWISPWTAAGYWFTRHKTAVFAFATALVFSAAAGMTVQDRLRESANRELLFKAVKTSVELKRAMESTSNRTEPEMRSARRAMRAARWLEARDLLQTSVNVNQEFGLVQAMTEAQLELARTETMLHNSLRALDVYRSIWNRGDVPVSLRQIAAFEGSLLLLLDQRHAEVRELSARMESLHSGPYPLLMRLALNEPLPAEWDKLRAEWQNRLRWSAVLAEVVRDRHTAERAGLHRRLDELQREGDTTNDWPLPLASYLRGRLQ